MQNNLLKRSTEDWRRLGGLYTAEEIAQQPLLWRVLGDALAHERQRLAGWLGDGLARPELRVLLTGAGSSAFVGEIAADLLNRAWPAQIRAVATTSLLTHPELHLEPEAPTLLVSFARSGNSPESLAVVEMLRQQLKTPPRFLNITCNAEGALARAAEGRADSLNLLMPPGSCDRGFAMTSSFSCMLLAALALLGREPDPAERIARLAASAEAALTAWESPLQQLAERRFARIVYLGSGPLEALAKEAALKVLELSGGQALAIANTALGFRHGPKSALNADTLVLLLRSSKPLAARYEQDLLEELRAEGVAGCCVSIGPNDSGAEFDIGTPAGWGDAWLAPLWLLAAQLFALHQSAALGLHPDNPFPDGTVNRVVQGVSIHEHEAHA